MIKIKLWPFVLIVHLMAWVNISEAQVTKDQPRKYNLTNSPDSLCWKKILNQPGISPSTADLIYDLFFNTDYNEEQREILEDLKQGFFKALCKNAPHRNIAAVSIYPNPTHHKLTLTGLPAGNYTVYIFDVYGNAYQENVIVVNEEKCLYVIDTSELPPAMYLMLVEGNNFYQSFQFVKKI
jgi:hypothetical protein